MSYFAFELLTSPDAAGFTEAEDAVALIPTGAVEQHGPHLPLGTDALIAAEVGRRIGGLLSGPVVVAPVIPLGLSDHHVDFPGTVTVSEETFDAMVRAYVEAFCRIGIERVALVSAHGGNYAAIGRIAHSYASSQTQVIAFSDPHAVVETLLATAEAMDLRPARTDVHAGLIETSMILAILGPNAIELDLDGIEGLVSDSDEWLEVVLEKGISAVSANGVMGRPAGATAHFGEAALDGLAGMLADWMQREFALQAGPSNH